MTLAKIVVLGSLLLQTKPLPLAVEACLYDAWQSEIIRPRDSQMQAYVLPGTVVLGAYLRPFFKKRTKNLLPSFLSGIAVLQIKTRKCG